MNSHGDLTQVVTAHVSGPTATTSPVVETPPARVMGAVPSWIHQLARRHRSRETTPLRHAQVSSSSGETA